MLFKQAGSVLIFSLVILFILSLVGVASMENVTLNERMASNYRDHDAVFQAAEAALAEGEQAALAFSDSLSKDDFQPSCSGSGCFTAACSDGLCFNGGYLTDRGCDVTPPAVDLWLVEDTWTVAGRAKASIASFPALTTQPKYIIEFQCYAKTDPLNGGSTTHLNGSIGDAEWAFMYQITALAEGATGGTRAMVQSTYKVLQN